MSNIDNPLLAQNPTINPYRYAAYEFLNRLKWDLHPESWRSRNKLKLLNDNYRGKKAVILCNGPSLLKSDLSLLKDVYTFGLNKINLLFDQTDFRPSCIVSVNSFVIEQNAEFYNQTEIPLFLDRYATKFVNSRSNIIFLHSSKQQKFARDCSLSVWNGFTVTCVALQLAFHMGFKEVALVGCDHSFSTKGSPNETVVSEQKDENHFAPNYFSDGVKWQLPDLAQSEAAYNLAKEVYQLSGRKLVNCTEGGQLHVFPRMKLQEYITPCRN